MTSLFLYKTKFNIHELSKSFDKIIDLPSEEVLKCENLNLETISSILNIENKYVSELVTILNTIAHHRDMYENTINQVIPQIAQQIELKTHENGIINYIYSNLYDKLSNDDITKLIEEIKKGASKNE